jgi:outer membrane lipoprotein-sorting protein
MMKNGGVVPMRLFLLLSVVVMAGWGQNLQDIQGASSHIRSIQSSFIQYRHLDILPAPLESRGVICFQAPGSLRWEYREPIRSILLMDAGKVSRFVETGGVFVEDAGPGVQGVQAVLGEITNWMNGRYDLSTMFKATVAEQGAIVLVPMNEALSRMIRRIVIRLSPTPGIIESVAIEEGGNASTVIEFHDTRVNPPIDATMFRPPK